jgi:ribonuclease-3 family protein
MQTVSTAKKLCLHANNMAFLSKNRSFLSLLFCIVCQLLATNQCEAFKIQRTNGMSIRQETILFGGSNIQRAGPSSDDIPVAPVESESKTEDMIPIPNYSLDVLLSPSSSLEMNQMGPTALAYIGDVVFELFVRSRKLWPSRRTIDLQQQVVSLVNAEHQSKLLAELLETFVLLPDELQILQRGRNSSTSKSNNRKNPKAYQDSTAIEALVGYLYITDKKRLEDLFNWMHVYLERV